MEGLCVEAGNRGLVKLGYELGENRPPITSSLEAESEQSRILVPARKE